MPVPTNQLRKRKSSQPGLEFSSKKQAVTQNKSHSIVEKRYRTNLNQKIAELAECIPSLKKDGQDHNDAGHSLPTLRHNKATVLAEAIAYIQQLQCRNDCLEKANAALQQPSRNQPQNHDIDAGKTVIPSAVEPPNEAVATNMETKPPSKPIQGMLKVPEEWRKLWRGELKQYSPEQEEPKSARQSGTSSSSTESQSGKYVRRVPAGSLAALMLLDG